MCVCACVNECVCVGLWLFINECVRVLSFVCSVLVRRSSIMHQLCADYTCVCVLVCKSIFAVVRN